MPDFQHSLTEIYERYRGETGGRVATYIPQLAEVDPNLYAVSAVTCDGRTFSIGDSDARFTIQSTSKPFSYALALEHYGEEYVLARVGVEPTGEDYHSITKLDQMQRPMNPMVNSGALAVCSLLTAAGVSIDDVIARYSAAAGESVRVDQATYASEMGTTDGNRAIVYLLRKFNVLAADPLDTLELYVKICSLQTTAKGLATMGATLANGGRNPRTGSTALPPEHVRDVLSVMLTCGMYNYAGQWVYDVGVPAKSGVSGAVLMIVPSVMAVCVYSPRLDERGTSVRGIATCKDISARHRLHLLHPACPKDPGAVT